MTLTFELELDSVKTNQPAKCRSKSFRSKARTHTDAHSADWTLASLWGTGARAPLDFQQFNFFQL